MAVVYKGVTVDYKNQTRFSGHAYYWVADDLSLGGYTMVFDAVYVNVIHIRFSKKFFLQMFMDARIFN